MKTFMGFIIVFFIMLGAWQLVEILLLLAKVQCVFS